MTKAAEAFRTISEVAEALGTPAHVLRFWESKFPQLKPVKRAGGRRYYRPSDVALLAGIKVLLHDRGITIRGVQKILREQGVRQVAAETADTGAATPARAPAPTRPAASRPAKPRAPAPASPAPQTATPAVAAPSPPAVAAERLADLHRMLFDDLPEAPAPAPAPAHAAPPPPARAATEPPIWSRRLLPRAADATPKARAAAAALRARAQTLRARLAAQDRP